MNLIFNKVTVGIVLILSAMGVSAATINFTPNDPWGPDGTVPFTGVKHTQQAYSSSIFSGPLNISSVSFTVWLSSVLPSVTPIGASNWLMTLSTSRNPLSISSQTTYSNGGLSNIFDNNVGADATAFNILTLSGTYTKYQQITFNGSFNYDPSAGDLLVDIKFVGGTLPTSPNIIPMKWGGSNLNSALIAGDTSGPVYSCSPLSVGLSGGCGALYTQFQVGAPSSVPIPATYAMLLSGLGMMGVVARRRKQQRAT